MPHRSAAQMYRAARKSDALLTGAPLPTLFYFALPIILGNIFQQLYSIVDAIVVGKFLGDLPLAGISVAAPIVDVANALVIGGTIGIGVLCAQMCGAEDWTRLRCMNATALLGGAGLLVSMRLHALIFADAVGIPAVALSPSEEEPKLAVFARHAGFPHFSGQTVSVVSLCAETERIIENKNRF